MCPECKDKSALDLIDGINVVKITDSSGKGWYYPCETCSGKCDLIWKVWASGVSYMYIDNVKRPTLAERELLWEKNENNSQIPNK